MEPLTAGAITLVTLRGFTIVDSTSGYITGIKRTSCSKTIM
ncbi:hypothetical protein NSTC731_01209 [Nostoc sp. DSM 114167]